MADKVDPDIMAALFGVQPKQPGLTAGEKQELRMVAEHGRPLHKILKSMVDFTDERRDAIAQADLGTEEGMKLARQLQTERNAVLHFGRWFVEQFAYESPGNKQKDI